MLSKEQEKIVQTIHGPALCVACPGSGKTTVIVERVKYMLDAGIPASNILVITFTKNAAMEMQERFERKNGASSVCWGTIHSFCNRVISRAYGYSKRNILSAGEQLGFFYSILFKKVQTDNLEEYIKNLIGEISLVKNKRMKPEIYQPVHSKSEDFLFAFSEYEKYKKETHKIDFDDMLNICYECLKSNPEELDFWREKYKYIMVDEYQDTNQLQASILYLLAGNEGNLCVVGDDDQSCYRFRAADSRVFMEFPKRYPESKTFFLSTNYRSGTEIVHRADLLIQHNQKRFKKNFLTSRPDSGKVEIFPVKSSEQFSKLAKMLIEYHKKGVSWNEMAVLYRVNTQNQLLVGELLQKDIPFFCTEPPKDFHQDFIFQDVLAYYRLANGTSGNSDVEKVINRPNRFLKGKAFRGCPFEKDALLDVCDQFKTRRQVCKSNVFDFIQDVCSLRDKTPTAFLNFLFKIIGYERFISEYARYCQKDIESCNVLAQTLFQEATQFSTMEDWIAYADFYAKSLEKQRCQERQEGICLSTLHSAKGLEWKVVFIIDALEGIYPYKRADSPDDYEEERRLFYVGLTRAKDLCQIFVPQGEHCDTESRYIKEMKL